MRHAQTLAALAAFAMPLASAHANTAGKYLLDYNVNSVEVCYTYITVVPAAQATYTTISQPVTGTETITLTTIPPSGTVPGTVIIGVPTAGPDDPGFVTITREYEGTSSIDGPITSTVPPSGTWPGTVIVETPPPSPGFNTITVPYTGTAPITEPLTTTVPPVGTIPGTVIVQVPGTPPGFDTITVPYTGTVPITEPITTTVPPVGTTPGTVIIEVPPNFDTVTVPYTGTVPITGPITSTVPPVGTIPGTVIIETPIPLDSSTRAYTGTAIITGPTTFTVPQEGTTPGTVIVETPIPFDSSTRAYTGTAVITGPTTFTVPQEGTTPGTVIVETPIPFDSSTREYTGTATITGPTTITVPQEGTTPGTIIVETPPPEPTFACDSGGYLIQNRELYRLDLSTGVTELISDDVGPGGSINAIGYSVLDNYIYGMHNEGGSGQLIRIDAAGDAELLPLVLDSTWNTGDVDPEGRMFISQSGGAWAQIDLVPGSPTFGEVVAEGTSELELNAADWAYVPTGGDFLYSLLYPTGGADTTLARWSMITNEWEIIEEYGPIVGENTWGAMYSVGDGFLYASENSSGEIWQFPITGGEPSLVTQGPISSSNDGARCVNAPPPPGGVGRR